MIEDACLRYINSFGKAKEDSGGRWRVEDRNLIEEVGGFGR